MKRLLNNGARGSYGPAAGEYRGCPKCHGADLATVKVPTKAGERIKVVCADCGRFVRHAPSPWTPARAHAFCLPYGRHKGRTIGELARTLSGRGYIRWLGENCRDNVGKAARVALAAGPEYDPGREWAGPPATTPTAPRTPVSSPDEEGDEL
jgi:hypothetical protein